jgi:hypothetical protein
MSRLNIATLAGCSGQVEGEAGYTAIYPKEEILVEFRNLLHVSILPHGTWLLHLLPPYAWNRTP